jgi:hypothetical protein
VYRRDCDRRYSYRGTCHFTALEGGHRIDYILTTLPGVGAFSISGFDHRE